MTIRRSVLITTLTAASIALSGCGSSGASDTDTKESAPVIGSSIAQDEPQQTEEPEPEEPGIDPEDTDVEAEDLEADPLTPEGEEPLVPPVPKVSPDQVALSFQRALFAGDGATACGQLTKDAEKRLVLEGAAKGVISQGQNCNSYVVAVGNSYADWDVSMEAFPVSQQPRQASARIAMSLQGEPSQVRMKLTLVGAQWKISDWGSH